MREKNLFHKFGLLSLVRQNKTQSLFRWLVDSKRKLSSPIIAPSFPVPKMASIYPTLRSISSPLSNEILSGLLILGILLIPSLLHAKNADELYRQGRYEEAKKAYRDLDIENPRDVRYRYNMGCASYQKGDYKEAADAFTSVYRRSEDNEIKFKALYNLGNTAMATQNYGAAVNYFRQAVILNPGDQKARFNLELAIHKKKEADQKQNQDDQKGQSGQQEKEQNGQNDSTNNSGDQKDPSEKDKNEKDGSTDNDKKNESSKQENHKNNPSDSQQQDEESSNKSPDRDGELKSITGGDEKENAKNRPDDKPVMSLEQKKAKTLLDNINEGKRSLFYKLPSNQKQRRSTGKYW